MTASVNQVAPCMWKAITLRTCRLLVFNFIVRTQPGFDNVACRPPYAKIGTHRFGIVRTRPGLINITHRLPYAKAVMLLRMIRVFVFVFSTRCLVWRASSFHLFCFGLVSNIQMTASLDQVVLCMRNDDIKCTFLDLSATLERAGKGALRLGLDKISGI